MLEIPLSPPLVFALLTVFAILFYWILRLFSLSVPSPSAPGSQKAYACGEDVRVHKVQPNYAQFFPFAFFFTIMHVVALVLATLPSRSLSSLALAVLYLASAAVGLLILVRRS